MPISKAISFVKQVGYNARLREQCIQYADKEELLRDLGFSESDFENAINMQLVKCQTYEQAEAFKQIQLWFTLL